VDFGVAQWRQAGVVHTQAGVFLGSPVYAAPEQLRGEDLDARADVYAVGVVLFEMLTGQRPYPGPTLSQLVHQLVTTLPPHPSALRPHVSQELGNVVLKVLAQDRRERFPPAAAFAEALSAATASVEDESPLDTGPFDLPLMDASHTVRRIERSSYPIIQVPAGTTLDAVLQVVRGWRVVNVAAGEVYQTLAKVCETPLHTAPFAGSVQIGEALLLARGGEFVAALNLLPRGAQVVSEPKLPAQAPVRLYVPPEEDKPLVELLAGLITERLELLQKIDSSLVKGEELAARFARETFTGLVRVRAGGDQLAVLLVAGQPKLAVTAGQWSGVPDAESWHRWFTEGIGTLEVCRPASLRLDLTYRVRHRDQLVHCRWGDTKGTQSSRVISKRLASLAAKVASSHRQARLEPVSRSATDCFDLDRDPAYQLLRWLVADGSAAAEDSTLSARWKYLLTWVPLIERATLHHRLPRPNQEQGEEFNLVTQDKEGKVLHLGVVLPPHAAPGTFAAVLHRAIAAKLARVATGDVGALLVAAPSFPQEFLSEYFSALESHTKGLARLQETLTGYAGFVRLRRDRGFHVLLLQQDQDRFLPMWE